MPDILHRVGINAKPDRVFDALTTIEGVQNWWVENASGTAGQGGLINYGFCDMQVVAAEPDRLVQWHCTDGPADWIDTEVIFQLEYKEDQTYVIFKHANWREPVEFMHHCSTKWATFLLSLRDLVEKSEGHPLPRDLKIAVNG